MKEELSQSDYTVNDNITVLHNEEIMSTTIVDGYNYALEEDPYSETLSITPVTVNLIALNQHPFLSSNILFLRETALINELVAESIKRFVANESLTRLTTDQLLKTTKLYMTAAIYVQDLQIEDWNGHPSTIKLFHTALRELNSTILGYQKITSFPIFTSVGILVIYSSISSRKSRKRRKINRSK